MWLRPAQASVRLTDGIALDLDATPLAAGSNHRLIAVAADAPEAVADPQAFAADSTPIQGAPHRAGGIARIRGTKREHGMIRPNWAID